MEPNYPEILFCNARILVCVKQPGQLAEPGGPNSLPELAARRLAELGKPSQILTVHRLDRQVGGLTLLARDAEAAGDLIGQIAAHEVDKDYFAVLRGVPAEKDGVLEDLLFHDSRDNKTYVVSRERKGVRKAKLAYRTLASVRDGETELTLVRIRLYTGRTHQIRAQFSSRGLPLLGDVRYGSNDHRCKIALWSCWLRFRDPASGRVRTCYQRPPEAFPWTAFPGDRYQPYTPF